MKRFLVYLALIVGFSVLLACPVMGDFSFTGNNTTASFNFSFDGCDGATAISAGGFNGFANISILSSLYQETISIGSIGNFSVSMILGLLGFSEKLSISGLGGFSATTLTADFISILNFHGLSATISKMVRAGCGSGNCGILVSITIGGEEIWIFIPEEEREELGPPPVDIILRELGFDEKEIQRLIDEFGRSDIRCALFDAEFEYDNAHGFDIDAFYLSLYGYNVLGGVFMPDDGSNPFVYIKVFNGYTGEEVMANPISITFVNVMTFPQDIHHFNCFSWDPELLDENLSEEPGYYTYPIPIAAGEDCIGRDCLPNGRLGPVDLASQSLFPGYWNIYIGLPSLCSFKEIMLPVVVTNLGEVLPRKQYEAMIRSQQTKPEDEVPAEEEDIATSTVPADQVRIGDLVLEDYVNQWPFGLPDVDISIETVQDVGSPQLPYVDISGHRRAEQLWMYVFVDGNKLLYREVVRNGVYQVPISDIYNDSHWNVGWNTLTFVFSSAPRWEFEPNRTLSEAGAWNFIGYPPSGYVMIRQVSFEVR